MKAILTGHTRGIGSALVEALLTHHIPVLALARRQLHGPIDSDSALLRQIQLDLADTSAVQRWLDGNELKDFILGAETLLLINNAGTLGPMASPGYQEAADIIDAISLNVTSPLLLTNAVTRECMGALRIAHISSGAGRNAYPGWSIYGATKAALDHHARVVHAEQAPRLRISSIAPGVVDTDMQTAIRQSNPDEFPLQAQFVALKEQGKLSPPSLIAQQLLTYLLSDEFGHEPVVDLRDLPSARAAN